jgi:cytochrome c553
MSRSVEARSAAAWVTRIAAAVLSVAAAGAALAQSQPAGASPQIAKELAWAYAITPGPAPAAAAAADDGRKYTLPGSELTFTLDQIRNRMGPADWYPGDHPPMPPIVAKGREAAGVWACGLCHYPNGHGRPENAGVAGLSKEYFVQQLYDFKRGLRGSAEPLKPNTPLMAGFAVAMTDEEIHAAAEYFAAIPWTPWIEVVEAASVPKTRPAGGMWLRLEGADAGMEPIGRRNIETPNNTEYTEKLRNPRSGFTAYVPPGSIAKGKALAEGSKTTQCAACHGAELDGLSVVPTLRGRSPSYLARQLADFKAGTRHGLWTPLMAPVVANLNSDDILNLSAYLSSLPPRP